MTELSAEDIINTIVSAPKLIPVRVDLAGSNLQSLSFPASVETFLNDQNGFVYGDWEVIKPVLAENEAQIERQHVEIMARNSGVPLLNYENIPARIEPGAIIRDQVVVGKNAVIMMGATINIGAEIGEGSMIDMGAVLGGRSLVGKHSHIGANAVLAGVVEPASAQPVRVGDDVLVGVPAKVIKTLDEKTKSKTALVDALRQLD